MKPAVLAVCFITLSCLAAQALTQSKNRGRIRGLVTDEAKHPIVDAVLGIAETTAQGELNEMAPMTNEHGQFEFTNLPPGRYTLLINAPGYQARKHVVEVKAGETAKTEITLQRNNR